MEKKTIQRKMKERWIQFFRVAPCLMAIIVDYTGYGLVYPLVTAMFTAGGNSIFPNLASPHLQDFYLGLAYLLYPLGMFFGASFLGDISDLWGRKKVILTSVAGICLSFLVMSVGIFLRDVYIFLLGRLFSGLMAGSQPLAQAAIADVSSEETKPWNMNLITLTNCVGLVFGPIVAGVFSETWFIQDIGYSPPFLFAALLAFLTFFWIVWGFKETYLVPQGKKIEWVRPARIFVEAFLHPKVKILSIIILLFQLAVALYFQMLGIYFSQAFHYSSSLIGFFYAFLGLSFVLGTLWFYPFALKYWKLETMTIIGLIVMGTLECIVSFSTIDWLIWVIVFVMALFNILAWTPLLTITSNAVDETRQGWVMGVFSAMVAVGFILAGLSSNLLPWIASNHMVFIGGLMALFAGLLMIYYRSKHAVTLHD